MQFAYVHSGRVGHSNRVKGHVSLLHLRTRHRFVDHTLSHGDIQTWVRVWDPGTRPLYCTGRPRERHEPYYYRRFVRLRVEFI